MVGGGFMAGVLRSILGGAVVERDGWVYNPSTFTANRISLSFSLSPSLLARQIWKEKKASSWCVPAQRFECCDSQHGSNKFIKLLKTLLLPIHSIRVEFVITLPNGYSIEMILKW